MITKKTKLFIVIAAICTAITLYIEWTKPAVCPEGPDSAVVVPHFIVAAYQAGSHRAVQRIAHVSDAAWPKLPKWARKSDGACVPSNDVDGNPDPSIDDTGLVLTFLSFALWGLSLVSLQADLGYWWKQKKRRSKHRRKRRSSSPRDGGSSAAQPVERVEDNTTPADSSPQ